MSEPNEPTNKPSFEPLTEEQSIVGVTRHSRTGAFIVWVSLEGNDITPVGAWKDEATAGQAVEETAHEFHRMVDAMDKAAPGDAEEAGIQHWVTFLDEMKAKSDAAMTPFEDNQLYEIGQNIAQMLRQRKNVPNAPEGFARVLIYSDAALSGATMPRVRLAPMSMPPRRKGHKASKGKQSQPQAKAPTQSPLPAVSPIYLSYTDAVGVAPFFQVLDGADGLKLVKDSAKVLGRVATVLHTRGKADDAPLEIVCVTDASISQAQAEAISQAAINYAMDTGLIPMRKDEPMQPPQGGSGYGFSPN